MQTLVARHQSPGTWQCTFTGSWNLKGGPSSGHHATGPAPPQIPHHPPHHGAGLPAQQGHQVAVLTQQVQRGVLGVPPLALEGDEDRSACEL